MGGIIDEDFLSFSSFVEELADMENFYEGEVDKMHIMMQAEKIQIEMPIDLDIREEENGKLKLFGIPPMYYLDTSFMPVYHQVKLRMEIIKK